mmetsp:Transcript_2513/g.2574  ORF Transcript_2513/g.2574 Transcript_2513/m.2574 type:complete len:162 (-) Transcript_2513:332-817(-)
MENLNSDTDLNKENNDTLASTIKEDLIIKNTFSEQLLSSLPYLIYCNLRNSAMMCYDSRTIFCQGCLQSCETSLLNNGDHSHQLYKSKNEVNRRNCIGKSEDPDLLYEDEARIDEVERKNSLLNQRLSSEKPEFSFLKDHGSSVINLCTSMACAFFLIVYI